ncbi:MAG: hypothetical protein K5765_06515, partial [Clostridia bacterium]|nr:hypothetical protein [Clostridia bacterium]
GKGDSVLTLEAEINKNREELEKNKKEKELIDKELNLINGELKKLEESARSNDEIVSKIDKELLSHKNDIDNHQKEIDRLDKENNKLEEQNKNIDQDKTDKSILLEAAKQKMGNQNTEKSDANSLLKQMSDDINVLETKQSELQNSISLKVDQVNKIESDIKLIKQEVFNIEKSISAIQEEMTSLTAQIVIKEGEINAKEKELKELIDKAIKNEALADKRVVLDDLDKEKKELAEIVDNIYQKLLKLSEQVTTESENKARVETQLDNLKKEINDTTSKIAEDYELDYDAALEYKLEEYDDKDAQNEMKSLKRQLTSLGEINEKAIEDLEIKNKEYNDTKIQYDDCVNSKASILETIKSLTANMEQKFKASFDIIRDNFIKVFNDMFDGGHGDIKIAYKDGVSILDCGVIIEADPPGKKLHNIELLSGGERSLTAIALVFAIQGLNPAPFCVLDEVDSALDDSNAVVYAKFLRKFSGKTQFIIVSHRKPTIELANQIYGITMEEKGVSKLFSVKLSEALRLAKQGDSN